MSEPTIDWDVAKRVAGSSATGSTPDPLPTDLGRWDGIARAAELALNQTGAVGGESGLAQLEVVTREGWAVATLDNLRPIVERLAGRFGGGMVGLGQPGADPAAAGLLPEPLASDPAMLGTMQAMQAAMKPLAPIMAGMQMGMVMGVMAQHALSQYDLSLPRRGDARLQVIASNVDALARELVESPDAVRLWVLLHERAHHAVFTIRWAAERLLGLIEAYVDSLRFNASELQQMLANVDISDAASLQRLFGDGDNPLGRFLHTSQPDVLDSAQTFIAVVEAYVDLVVERAASTVAAGTGAIGEALTRRHQDQGGARLLDAMLGLPLDEERLERAADFCAALVREANGDLGPLNRMWESIETFPTKEELARPHAWRARIESLPPGGLFNLE